MDKFNFKIIMYIISFIEIGVSLTIYSLVDYPLIFIMENLLIALCLSGTFTTITPLFNKVFGNDYGSAMYGITGFSIGIASFCGPLLTKLLIKENADYLKIYIFGGIICLIKLIVLFTFDENKKFEFEEKEKQTTFEMHEKIEENNEGDNFN